MAEIVYFGKARWPGGLRHEGPSQSIEHAIATQRRRREGTQDESR